MPRSGVDNSGRACEEDIGEQEHISSDSDGDDSNELESRSTDEDMETLDRPRRKK